MYECPIKVFLSSCSGRVYIFIPVTLKQYHCTCDALSTISYYIYKVGKGAQYLQEIHS